MLHLTLEGLSVEICKLHAVRADHREVAVGQEENVARVIKNRGNVGGDKIFVVAEANYKRRTVARGHDLVRLIHGDDGQSKDAGEFLDGLTNRLFQMRMLTVAGFEEVFFDQVGDDFSIGFGRELVAFLDQLFL
jgi:hypothetical protein